jgi:hypothetical protein
MFVLALPTFNHNWWQVKVMTHLSIYLTNENNPKTVIENIVFGLVIA